jgi:hypothetical protein
MTPASQPDKMFEALLEEYKVVAERYENIYKAIWQHFSYMAALAAGIVAFGSQALPSTIVPLAASAPLLFWFYASYLTMDHYARSARRRAADIEIAINSLVFGVASNPISEAPAGAQWRMWIFWLLFVGGLLLSWFVDVSQFALGRLGVASGLSLGIILISWALSPPSTRSTTTQSAPQPDHRNAGADYDDSRDVHKVKTETLAVGESVPTVPSAVPQPMQGMHHFQGFGNDDPALHWRKDSIASYLHVNQVVIFCFLVLTLVWVSMLRDTYRETSASARDNTETLQLRTDTVSIRMLPTLPMANDSQGMRASIELRALQDQLRKSDSSLAVVKTALCASTPRSPHCDK